MNPTKTFEERVTLLLYAEQGDYQVGKQYTLSDTALRAIVREVLVSWGWQRTADDTGWYAP
jgi:hypothetical protein